MCVCTYVGAFIVCMYTLCLWLSPVGCWWTLCRCTIRGNAGVSCILVLPLLLPLSLPLLSFLPSPPLQGQRGVERMNAVVQGLVLRRMKSDLGMDGKELVRGKSVLLVLTKFGTAS